MIARLSIKIRLIPTLSVFSVNKSTTWHPMDSVNSPIRVSIHANTMKNPLNVRDVIKIVY